jgi:hypothetical protein
MRKKDLGTFHISFNDFLGMDDPWLSTRALWQDKKLLAVPIIKKFSNFFPLPY